MSIKENALIYWVVVGILALLVASPFLSKVLVYPRTEFFTELWILDADHKTENYPFNITQNQNYTIFLGIGNHLGYCAYYIVQVKFRNQTQPAPTSFGPIENRSPSNLTSLLNITAFVADEQNWESPLTFSFNYAFDNDTMQVNFYSLIFNDVVLDLGDYTIAWDSEKNGFFGFLFFELWLYNSANNIFEYHGRFVSLRLNMTTF